MFGVRAPWGTSRGKIILRCPMFRGNRVNSVGSALARRVRNLYSTGAISIGMVWGNRLHHSAAQYL